MKEYSITMCKDGSALLSKDPWNPKCLEETDIDRDGNELSSKPYLYKEGMQVVDIFGTVQTIESIVKFPQTNPAICPSWIICCSNGNQYPPRELAGIFVREVSAHEIEAFIKGL